MTEFYNQILNILKQDTRFFTESNEILRNVIYEAAMKMDKLLIKLLLSNEITKEHFFVEIDGVMVFDKVGFGWVINNREFLPDSYTRYKNKIGLINKEGNYINNCNDVELVFPYKDCILEGGQTKDDQKRNEIFYNENLAVNEVDRLLDAKVFTAAKRYTKEGIKEISEFSNKDNLIIKGNNLLVISSLLKRYEGKIKCIYIDPPYNPSSQANTFAYNNTFNRSSWLVFMKNRLEIAKRLLSSEGVIVVAIDKNEQPRLQILIEEIFSERDIDCITILHNPRGTIGTNFSYTHEFAIFATPKSKRTICKRKLQSEDIEWSPLRNWGGESLRSDAKNCFYPIIVKSNEIIGFGDVCDLDFHPNKRIEKKEDKYYIYPIDSKGIERKWRYARQTVESIKNSLRVNNKKSGMDIEIGKNFGTYKTVWVDSKYDASVNGTKLLKSILPGSKFTYPKSLYNVMDCIKAVVDDDKDAIILDFFGGSGTTGHAVMEINKNDGGNRKFILVEQMEYIETETLPRNVEVMKKIAQLDSIVYFELKKLNKNYMEEIQLAVDDENLNVIWNKMKETGFISSKINPSDIDFGKEDFKELSIQNKKRLLLELIDKNQLYVNYCDIDDLEFNICEGDKKFTNSFYNKQNN